MTFYCIWGVHFHYQVQNRPPKCLWFILSSAWIYAQKFLSDYEPHLQQKLKLLQWVSISIRNIWKEVLFMLGVGIITPQHSAIPLPPYLKKYTSTYRGKILGKLLTMNLIKSLCRDSFGTKVNIHYRIEPK